MTLLNIIVKCLYIYLHTCIILLTDCPSPLLTDIVVFVNKRLNYKYIRPCNRLFMSKRLSKTMLFIIVKKKKKKKNKRPLKQNSLSLKLITTGLTMLLMIKKYSLIVMYL